jgi:hypothetical protein
MRLIEVSGFIEKLLLASSCGKEHKHNYLTPTLKNPDPMPTEGLPEILVSPQKVALRPFAMVALLRSTSARTE